MGLLIYSDANPSAAFSSDGIFTNPLLAAFNGVTGNTKSVRYYVRNDESNKSYSGISLQPVLLEGTNIINGTDGFGWKLYAGDTQPLEEQWSLTSYANSITIPDIGSAILADVNTYEPFWLRISVPTGASIRSYSGVKLRISYTEILVP